MRTWMAIVAIVVAGCGSSSGSSGTGGASAGTGGATGGSGTGGAVATGGTVGTGGATTGGTGGATSTGGTGVDAGPDVGAGTGGASSTGGTAGGTGGSGGDAGTGARCGGLQGLKCPAGQWCDYPDDSCGAADQQGDCKPLEPMIVNCGDPVCGCNGKAYPNACRAHHAGVDTAGRTCIPGNGGPGVPCGVDGDCQAGSKCCESGGSANSSLICRPLPAGMACPLVP